jgi:hypothetical protein
MPIITRPLFLYPKLKDYNFVTFLFCPNPRLLNGAVSTAEVIQCRKKFISMFIHAELESREMETVVAYANT